MNYRKLSESEVKELVANNCCADDWSSINVVENFKPERIKNITFSGINYIGLFEHEFTFSGGISMQSGLSNARIHNCRISDNVVINNVANYIANYDIEEGAYIENVSRIAVTEKSSFGNGSKVSVLNESGGRDVPIYDKLSAHLAYMIAMYRYHPNVISRVTSMIEQYAENVSSSTGRIGKNARIINCNLIENVIIGDNAKIEGASRLSNGSIASSELDPVVVGNNVIAEDFIMCSGARVEDGAVIVHSFVGQGCHISHLFSAHDSLFFANCACENGEAAAIFGGPYTVTMHKSSLLIAGMFSFINAGSGSNQSNHMYKLGPIHQGVVERGSKTTSDSYILWPAKIGAFSLVMGRHVSHPDTSRLPFSYLIENKGKSYLVPGVNLKSVGTIRDAQKWPKRDKRKDSYRLDLINFNLLSPFTIGKMFDAVDLLNQLEEMCGLTADRYAYQSMTIEPGALRKGREYYMRAIDKFMGNSIIKRLENPAINTNELIRNRLKPTTPTGEGEWIDMSGLILPKTEIITLIKRIENGEICSLEPIEEFFKINYDAYYDMEWTWVVSRFSDWYGKSIDNITAKDIVKITERWQSSVRCIDDMLYNDARKEFSLVARTGFGIDGCAERKDCDFEQVRGAFEQDSFVKMVTDHIKAKTELGDNLISRMRAIEN